MQLSSGPHAGGITGRIDERGRPAFVYLEATGYYLTAVAWCAGRDGGTHQRDAALARGRRAFDWLCAVTENGALPATRIHLDQDDGDWRNAAVFTFDLAIAARGVGSLATVSALERADELQRDLADHVQSISGDEVLLASHGELDDASGPLPARWSTLPGPHHAKAAAALLQLPVALEKKLEETCARTITHWRAELRKSWPCEELHPLLYGLEGLLIGPDTDAPLDDVEAIFEQVLALQGPDGTLPPERNGAAGPVRADVLAQALRVGALLRAEHRLAGSGARQRLDALAGALLRHVRRDGAVLFSPDHDVPNAWCAMFAAQALHLHAGGDGAHERARHVRAFLV